MKAIVVSDWSQVIGFREFVNDRPGSHRVNLDLVTEGCSVLVEESDGVSLVAACGPGRHQVSF